MVKRASRENAKDRKASADLSDNDKKQRYNFRKRKLSSGSEPPNDNKKIKHENKEELLWVDDDNISEDSFEPDHPVSVNIHFHATLPTPDETESEYDSEGDEEETSSDDQEYIKFLMDKYIPPEEPKKKKPTKKEVKLPIKLTPGELKYYKSLSPAKQASFLETMIRIAKMGFEDGDIPYKFKILDTPIPDYAKSQIIKKVNSLTEMPPDSGEAYKLKNWIDGLLRIPFGKTTPLPVKYTDGREKCTEFMINAKNTMNKYIYGMQTAKTQIMQILAQLIVNPNSVGNVIALRGPMGVGKTSFAKNAIAKVLDRPFQFFSLGGASDISNYVGHSYTYEGSIWGRIADALMHSGTMNPVFYFDELDKISSTPHGEEIISMMIHMTDRSQNSEFHDRYFSGIDFDISQCLFVFSLNDIEKVHPILRDRMTIINCEGYNEKDKKEILKDYVLPQLLDRLKFDSSEITFTDEAMEFIIHEYSKEEKGVRTLIRTVESLMTRLNMLRVACDDSMKEYSFYMQIEFPLVIDKKIIATLLGDLTPKEDDSWVHMYS